MTSKPEAQALINRAIAAVLPEAQALVASIEAQAPVTQNHYGAYMAALGRFEGTARQVMALAFGVAGANREGLKSACRALGMFG